MGKKILFIIVILLAVIIFTFIYFFNSKPTDTTAILVKPEVIAQKKQLEKLTPDSLLIQIDKKHCLAPEYAPQDLVGVLSYGISANSSFRLRKIAMPELVEMVTAAQKEGIELKVISAYRSYADQQRIYSSWVAQLGAKEASRQSAPPGCSQHELGTAVDFNELNDSFANTPTGIWLSKNAWQFGWVISYPLNSENITGYVYEPWHYRYIGKVNAKELEESGLILSKFLDTKNNL